MKCLERNKQTIHYSLYQGYAEVVDASGYYTGERAISYSDPVEIQANVSVASGQNTFEQFGSNTDYDRIIVTDIDLPITEESVFYIDTEPEYTESGECKNNFDYTVRKISKSLNHMSIAVNKVVVS